MDWPRIIRTSLIGATALVSLLLGAAIASATDYGHFEITAGTDTWGSDSVSWGGTHTFVFESTSNPRIWRAKIQGGDTAPYFYAELNSATTGATGLSFRKATAGTWPNPTTANVRQTYSIDIGSNRWDLLSYPNFTVNRNDGGNGVFTGIATIDIVGGPVVNDLPIADAGPDIHDFVAPGELYELLLDGGDSYDSDGTIVSYQWQLDGETVGTDAVLEVLQGPMSCTYFLRVVDDDGGQNVDSVQVNIEEDNELALPEEIAELKIRGPGDLPAAGEPPRKCGRIDIEGVARAAAWDADRTFRLSFDKSTGVEFSWPSIEPTPLTDGFAAAKLVGQMASIQATNMDNGRRWVANHLIRDAFVTVPDPTAVSGEDVGDIMAAHGEPDCIPLGGAATDSDGDGIADDVDPDRDGDGIDDEDDPIIDSDGDGVPDEQDDWIDSDGDGIPDFNDPDIDGDSIPNSLDNVPAPYSPGGPLYQPWVPETGQGGVSPPYQGSLPPGGGGIFELPEVEIEGPAIEGGEELGVGNFTYEIPIPIPGVDAGQSTFFVATNDVGGGELGTATNALWLLVRGIVLLSVLIAAGRASIQTLMVW